MPLFRLDDVSSSLTIRVSFLCTLAPRHGGRGWQGLFKRSNKCLSWQASEEKLDGKLEPQHFLHSSQSFLWLHYDGTNGKEHEDQSHDDPRAELLASIGPLSHLLLQ